LSQESVVKPSNDAYRLAQAAALAEINSEESNTSLKKIWIDLGNQLQIEGIPSENICVIASDLILTKKSEKTGIPKKELRQSGYFYRVYNEEGWTNQFFARNTTVPLGEQENSSINTTDKNTTNQEMIDIFLHIKEICTLGIQKVKELPEFETIFGQKETREFYRQTRSYITNCRYILDNKTKIPENTELLFLECVSTSKESLHVAVKIFHDSRMKLLEQQGKKLITAKQTSKYLHGEKESKLPLLKPNTRDSAVFADYFGVQCENSECKSWRVRQQADTQKIQCFDCGLLFNAKTISKCRYCQMPLFKENLQHIIKTNKCENCNTDVILPEELVQYANS